MANTQWAECFPTARCKYLGFESSDHKPLISFFDRGNRRKRGMFRYDRRLCKNEEAKRVIADSWRATTNAFVSDKLSSARSAISAWNKTQQRNSQRVIEEILNDNNTILIQNISETLNAATWQKRSTGGNGVVCYG